MWLPWSVYIKAWKKCKKSAFFFFFVVAGIHIDEKLCTSERGTQGLHVLEWQQVTKCMLLFCHFQTGFSQFTVFDCCSNLWFRSCKFCLYKASCLLFRNRMKSSQFVVLGVWDVLQYFKEKEVQKSIFL